MSTALSPRTPSLEWCHLAAAGELEQLSWVDTRLDPGLTGESQSARDDGGVATFRQGSYLRYLPPVVAEHALAAQRRGRVSGWEALQLLFARVEWLVRGRRYLWSPFSPVPRLLASFVETYGVDAGIHHFDRDRLARLTALLPVWHPYRGSVARAREVLAACDMEAELAGAVSADGDSGGAEPPRLTDEILMCHRLDWWNHRAGPGGRSELRISGNFVRFQPSAGDGFALRREDVLIHWQPGRPLPREAVRLLPAWMVVRLAAPT